MGNKAFVRTGALALALVMALAGCGQSGASSSEAAASEVEQAASSAAASSEVEAETIHTEYPVTVEVLDAEGNTVDMTFEAAPERVISTQLSMTELMLELGLGDKIVSVFDNDNELTGQWADDIAALPSLGDKKSVSKEAILALSPDLIVGKGPLMFTETSIGTVENYQSLGINVYTQLASAAGEQSLENVIQDIRNIGVIFDVQDAANAYAETLEAKLDSVLGEVSGKEDGEPVRVLFMAGYQDNTFSAFNSALSSCMLEAVNAENVLEKGAGGLTMENLIELDPDVIIYVKATRFAATDATAVDELLANETVQSVAAIANKRVVAVNYDDMMDYGARAFDSLETLYNAIYGE